MEQCPQAPYSIRWCCSEHWLVSETKSLSSDSVSTCWIIWHNPARPPGEVLKRWNWVMLAGRLSHFCVSAFGNSLPNEPTAYTSSVSTLVLIKAMQFFSSCPTSLPWIARLPRISATWNLKQALCLFPSEFGATSSRYFVYARQLSF